MNKTINHKLWAVFFVSTVMVLVAPGVAGAATDEPISLQKSADLDEVAAGSYLVYTLDWNVGVEPVTDLVISDVLPDEVKIISVMDDGEYSSQKHEITWELGDQEAGATGSVTYTVSALTNVMNGTEIINAATLSCNEADSIGAELTTVVTNVPILNLTKSVDKSSVITAGDEINYSIEVTNTGYATAENILLKDNLPKGMYFSDVLGRERVFVSGGDLAVGDALTFTYPVKIMADAKTGTYDNTVTLKADNYDTLVATTSVDVIAQEVIVEELTSPELVLEKVLSNDVANPGDAVEFTLRITNQGDGNAVNVIVNESLEAGLTFKETGGVTREWKLGDLEAGKSTSIVYEAMAADPLLAGIYDSVTNVTADNHGKVSVTKGVEITIPEVLGAETSADEEGEVLAATSSGWINYLALYIAAGLMLVSMALATWLVRRAVTKA